MAEGKEPASDPPAREPAAEPESAPKLTPEKAAEEDWQNRFKYLLAEFDNFRKRSERDRDASRRSARAEVIRELLRLFETFERAREAADTLPRDHPLRRGLDLLANDWQAFWRSEGIKEVAREGEKFRAEDHEAVAEAPAGPGAPEGTIVEIVQQGYRSPAGLLRPAKVVVARAPATAGPAEGARVETATPADEEHE